MISLKFWAVLTNEVQENIVWNIPLQGEVGQFGTIN